MIPDYPRLSLIIDGERREGGGSAPLPVVNPATGEALASLPMASEGDIDDALRVAERVAPSWRAVPAEQRGAILKRAATLLRERAERIAQIASLEAGKPLAEARMEVAMAASTLEWFGEEARRAYGRMILSHGDGHRMTVRREPIGPVASFSPWNFPIANPARKLAPALAAGCPVILKPAEETPASALAVADALIDAGLPAGVMAILFGEPSAISERLLASKVIRKISFTGSVPVGRLLATAAANNGQRATMELGGHGPVVIAADADLAKALDLTVASKFRNAGQVCVAPTRFLVEEPVFEAFLEDFVARAGGLRVGPGLADGTQMGPLIRERRRAAVDALVKDALVRGARLGCGGQNIPGPGYFYQPTVLSHVPQDARAMNEEPFGPIALINPVASIEAAIDEANRLPFGLAAYGFTSSQRTAMLLEENLEAGMIGINTTRISVPESPFGGVKASGDGSEEGIEGLDAYLVPKFVNAA
jgi:succinate-semialdehyde dehydrogenase/glutarate-semialdehyde dehydrogenase